jgi:GNAT superfamily N-acetyltransferase
MSNYPTHLLHEARELPDAVEQTVLNERGLFVMQGLDIQLAAQLVQASRQPHIQEYCPNDAVKRFGGIENVIDWQEKGRLALPLVRKIGGDALSLAGFGWIGPGTPAPDEPDIPGAKVTFAIRLYEDAVGQGNALPYTKAIIQANDSLYGNNGVWLEAWGDNPAALTTYEKAGFEKVAEMPGSRHGKVVPRVYMRLGRLAAD